MQTMSMPTPTGGPPQWLVDGLERLVESGALTRVQADEMAADAGRFTARNPEFASVPPGGAGPSGAPSPSAA